VQEYIHYEVNAYDSLKTIRPNVGKIFLDKLLTIGIVIILLVAAIIFVNSIVGLGIFLDILQTFNINVSSADILLGIILIIIVGAGLILLVNYLANKNVRYEFYKDRIRVCETQAFVIIQCKDIPLKNITRITYNYEGTINKILHSGTIILDITGMKETKQELRFVDNIEETVQYIQKILQEYQSLQQMQFQENYKIGNIMKKF
jgi:hypothetical protein